MRAGIVVQLKSGRPEMTVEKTKDGDWWSGVADTITCVWIDQNGNIMRHEFSKDLLHEVRR